QRLSAAGVHVRRSAIPDSQGAESEDRPVPCEPVGDGPIVDFADRRPGQILFNDGLEGFLTLEPQNLTEKPLGIPLAAPYALAGPIASAEHLDFRGAYGDYYRELFFHVPFRIASYLNASQLFEDAKWWYERIFDPTAGETPDLQK